LADIDPARMPATESAVASVLAKLPAAVGGHPLTSRGPRQVKYADGTTFTVAPLAEAAPGMTMRAFFTQFVASGQFTVTAQNAAGAPLLWFVGTGQAPYKHQVAAAAATSRAWLFGVDAASPAAADDLIAGFTAALH
jgi:hypothetical protein